MTTSQTKAAQMNTSVRVLVDTVIKDMKERPGDFHPTEHTLTDRKSGLRFWTSNGPFFVGIYEPFELKFGWYHGRRFDRAAREWKMAWAVRRLNTDNPST